MIHGHREPRGLGYTTVLADMDFETYSEAGMVWDETAQKWKGPPGAAGNTKGLPVTGASVYAEHPSTEVICLAYDLKDGAGPRLWTPGCPPPYDLFSHINTGKLIEAHNATFEFFIWHYVCHLRYGWPELPIQQLRCSMAKCYNWSLPGALGKAAAVLGGPNKNTEGEKLIRDLSIPKNPTKNEPYKRRTVYTHPDKFRNMYGYCLDDIKAEAGVSWAVPDLDGFEEEVFVTDKEIVTRGVPIDRKALGDCIAVYEQAAAQMTTELQQITGGAVKTASELQKITAWLAGRGVTGGSLDKKNMPAAIELTEPGSIERRVLEIRRDLGSASVKKLFAFNLRTNADGRIRDIFAYQGADRTGRWAGRGVQPQNLPNSGPDCRRCTVCDTVYWEGRVTLDDLCPVCGSRCKQRKEEWGIASMESALVDMTTRDLNYVTNMWGNPIAAVAGCLRGLFCAPEGSAFICSDYSAIEAVVLAFMAGEEWRMDVFRTHGKIYEMGASKITGIPFEEFARHKEATGQHHPMRKKVGKVSELASGYGGSLGAWKQFGAGAFMSDEEIMENVKKWRKASPMITKFWYSIQDAAVAAIKFPGRCYSYRDISYGVKNDVLYCRLPSGRSLAYHKPRVSPRMTDWGLKDQITFEGWDSGSKGVSKGWNRIETYYGKLTENIVQAVARDILAYALVNLRNAGYRTVMHIHDEIVVEVNDGEGSVEEVEEIMGRMPPWCSDWPVRAAGGWRGRRYRKD